MPALIPEYGALRTDRCGPNSNPTHKKGKAHKVTTLIPNLDTIKCEQLQTVSRAVGDFSDSVYSESCIYEQLLSLTSFIYQRSLREQCYFFLENNRKKSSAVRI